MNNYIRIGYPGSMTILTFDDRVPEEVEKVRFRMMEAPSSSVIGLWKKCSGLNYPLIGEAAPSRSFSSFLS